MITLKELKERFAKVNNITAEEAEKNTAVDSSEEKYESTTTTTKKYFSIFAK